MEERGDVGGGAGRRAVRRSFRSSAEPHSRVSDQASGLTGDRQFRHVPLTDHFSSHRCHHGVFKGCARAARAPKTLPGLAGASEPNGGGIHLAGDARPARAGQRQTRGMRAFRGHVDQRPPLGRNGSGSGVCFRGRASVRRHAEQHRGGPLPGGGGAQILPRRRQEAGRGQSPGDSSRRPARRRSGEERGRRARSLPPRGLRTPSPPPQVESGERPHEVTGAQVAKPGHVAANRGRLGGGLWWKLTRLFFGPRCGIWVSSFCCDFGRRFAVLQVGLGRRNCCELFFAQC